MEVRSRRIIRPARASKNEVDGIICDETQPRLEEQRTLSQSKFKSTLDEVVAKMQKIRDGFADLNTWSCALFILRIF